MSLSTSRGTTIRHAPAPDEEVIPGVKWGLPEALFTPAYWLTQFWSRHSDVRSRSHRLGQTFAEEVVACLLGGYGIPAEIGVAAFDRFRERHAAASEPLDPANIAEILREPLWVHGRIVKYRFWSQKSHYIAAALEKLSRQAPPLHSAIELRNYLMESPGIGPKTASWIVRNWMNSSEIAILDVHVVRAGLLMGLFAPTDDVDKSYFPMEARFLQLAGGMGIPAADLDSMIWSSMRATPRIVARALRLVTTMSESTAQEHRSKQAPWQRA